MTERPPVTPVAAWERDIDQVLAELRRRFPGTEVWHGTHTGNLWGLVHTPSGLAHLVEADTPAELAQRLHEAGARPDTRAASGLVQWPSGTAGVAGMVASVWTPPMPPVVPSPPATPGASLLRPAPSHLTAPPPQSPRSVATPPHTSPSRPMSLPRPASASRPVSASGARRSRGRHEGPRRRGWMRRLLDALTWSEQW